MQRVEDRPVQLLNLALGDHVALRIVAVAAYIDSFRVILLFFRIFLFCDNLWRKILACCGCL